MARLSRWLAERGLGPGDLSADRVEAFLGWLNRPGESGDSSCWESVRYGTTSEELPP
jgi:hypothetical protein